MTTGKAKLQAQKQTQSNHLYFCNLLFYAVVQDPVIGRFLSLTTANLYIV